MSERQSTLDLVKAGTTLNKIPKEFLSDKEICMEALKINPCSPDSNKTVKLSLKPLQKEKTLNTVLQK
jgi:hypothetical protein